MEENIVKKLMTSVKCTCGSNYKAADVSVLGNHNGMWFFRAYCGACQCSYLVAASVSAKNDTATDLTPTEFSTFKRQSTLTGDDFLDMHNFLNEFDGDFSRLFKLHGSGSTHPDAG